jgi:hypothetical protein
MTTQFLSRVEREVRGDSYPNVGPGGYQLPGGISRSLPGFAPFATTSSKYLSFFIRFGLLTMWSYVEHPKPSIYLQGGKLLAKREYRWV